MQQVRASEDVCRAHSCPAFTFKKERKGEQTYGPHCGDKDQPIKDLLSCPRGWW